MPSRRRALASTTTVHWTADDLELMDALRRLTTTGTEVEIVRAALRDRYRAITLLPWRPGAPKSFAAARREAIAARAVHTAPPANDTGGDT